jgi:poly-gamma-glutamate synthase PgsB/CapB
MALLSALLATGLAGYGVWEQRRHLARVGRVRHRVHVNGTRGKSSVTRLIAGGLRAGGLRTMAKTTGTDARLLLPDGSERPVYRVGRANILEQTRIVRRAVEEAAEALVIECMAVLPELQPVAELKLVRSTVGVITNTRADHLDVMGPTVDDVALALAQTLPVGGHAFTAERERFPMLERVARARGSVLALADASSVQPVELEGFSYIEHAENVALALAVCAHFGVGRADALRGMQQARPDPGVLRRWVVHVGHKRVEFVNAFAANDPDSTRLIWSRLGLDQPIPGTHRMVLANLRADRIQRSAQIAELVARHLSADHVFLSGEGTELVRFQAVQQGLDPARVTDLGGRSAESVFEHALDHVQERGVIVGIGNIVGLGEEIVLHFRNRAEGT